MPHKVRPHNPRIYNLTNNSLGINELKLRYQTNIKILAKLCVMYAFKDTCLTHSVFENPEKWEEVSPAW